MREASTRRCHFWVAAAAVVVVGAEAEVMGVVWEGGCEEDFGGFEAEDLVM